MKKLTGKAVAIAMEFYKQAVYDRIYYWNLLSHSYDTPREDINRRLWEDYTERCHAYKNLMQEYGYTTHELECIEDEIVCDFWRTHDA